MVDKQVPNEFGYQGFGCVLEIRIGQKQALSSVLGRCFIIGMIGSGG